ncbi:flagellar basal body-associated protein FliL [Yoonia sp. I 8.24]|uniref:flagellar basal body-associated FliL family protein n=1 Tax=Yoonia sp. I 8.24 TaxID=1537229 RepID=UPI001EDE2C94|nr:flagellar basal body-associated FliL family protein [Yoonia sp. I 8.24]MCG3269095.1 flagellar basal body-associated FliL family protein [Yoonia sp. I 8.24]
MSEESDTPENTPAKGSKKPLLIGIVLALLGAGGGFFAVQSGMLGGGEYVEEAEAQDDSHTPTPEVATFVALDPLVISLPRSGGRDHLRFSAQLEVAPEYADEVAAITPRIVDVLNGYLRAVDLADLEDPAALTRLRGQMLRRVQIVAGEGRVHDLLIMEFVLS